MFNVVVLSGRLTADPELRHTNDGVPVTSFSIAVSRRYKAGEEAKVDFINIVAWRHTAEFVSKYFQKGTMIGVRGEIRTNTYVDKSSGKKRNSFAVVADDVQFAEPKRKVDDSEPTDAAVNDAIANTDMSEFMDVSEEFDGDLPF